MSSQLPTGTFGFPNNLWSSIPAGAFSWPPDFTTPPDFTKLPDCAI